MTVLDEMARLVRDELLTLIQPVTLLTVNPERKSGAISGRFRSSGMLFDYSIRGNRVSYRPAGSRLDSGTAAAGFYETLAEAWQLASELAETAERLDTRCQKPDGTIYGTAGKCKQGRELRQRSSAKPSSSAGGAAKPKAKKTGAKKRQSKKAPDERLARLAKQEIYERLGAFSEQDKLTPAQKRTHMRRALSAAKRRYRAGEDAPKDLQSPAHTPKAPRPYRKSRKPKPVADPGRLQKLQKRELDRAFGSGGAGIANFNTMPARQRNKLHDAALRKALRAYNAGEAV
jgi:hypothetical protein